MHYYFNSPSCFQIDSPNIADIILKVMAENKGMVKLSSILMGIASNRVTAIEPNMANSQTSKLNPKNVPKVSKILTKETTKNAPLPSRVFPFDHGCVPNLIPIMADKGSAIPKI